MSNCSTYRENKLIISNDRIYHNFRDYFNHIKYLGNKIYSLDEAKRIKNNMMEHTISYLLNNMKQYVESGKLLSLKNAITDYVKESFVILQSLSLDKHFTILTNRYEIINIDPRYCFCEVIENNTAKPFIDFDEDVSDNMLNIERFLISYFSREYNKEIGVNWKWSNHRDSGRRWHCIISGIMFVECWEEECRKMVNELLVCFNNLKVDFGVYRQNSSLRMIGQMKLVDGIYCKTLYTYKISYLSDLLVRGNRSDIIIIRRNRIVSDISIFDHSCDTSRNSKLEYIINTFAVPKYFVLDGKTFYKDGMAFRRLRRRAPSYCEDCHKIHDKENCYLITNGEFIEMRCFRRREFLGKDQKYHPRE